MIAVSSPLESRAALGMGGATADRCTASLRDGHPAVCFYVSMFLSFYVSMFLCFYAFMFRCFDVSVFVRLHGSSSRRSSGSRSPSTSSRAASRARRAPRCVARLARASGRLRVVVLGEGGAPPLLARRSTVLARGVGRWQRWPRQDTSLARPPHPLSPASRASLLDRGSSL